MMYNNRKPIHAVGYVRASSKECQRRQYNTIPAQIQRLEDWTAYNNATIIKFFEDKSSGKDFDREGFQKMWQWCKVNNRLVTHVVCTDVTRFGREGATFMYWWKEFSNLEIEVNFISEWFDFSVPETKGIFYYRIGTAEAERERTGKRTSEIKASIRKSGFYADTPPAPWKYPPKKEGERKHLIPNEPAFSHYKEALKLDANSDLSQAEVIRIVNTKEYQISPSAYSRTRRNPMIAGGIPIWDYSVGKVTERPLLDIVMGGFPPLVDWDEYEKLQLKVRVKESPKLGTFHKNFNDQLPLKQLIQCPGCSTPIRAYLAKGRHGGKYGYYDCKHKHFRVSAKKANALIEKVLNLFALNPEEAELIDIAAKRAIHIMGVSNSRQIEQKTKTLKTVEAKINKLKADFLSISTEVFNNMMMELEAEKRLLESQLSKIKDNKSLAHDLRARMIAILAKLGDWWSEANARQQYAFLKVLFPEGFFITSEQIRTPRINTLIAEICSISEHYTSINEKSHEIFVISWESGGGGILFDPVHLSVIQVFIKTR